MGKYIALTSDEKKERISLLMNMWTDYLKVTIPNHSEKLGNIELSNESEFEKLYDVNLFAISEIFERIHKREDYFDRYHKKLKMSDFKEIGLIAFWLSKFKPFTLYTQYFNEAFSSRVNEEFALYYIFVTLANLSEKKGQQFDLSRINADLYNELLYSMQYRDLPKEAYGCIVELIYIASYNKIEKEK